MDKLDMLREENKANLGTGKRLFFQTDHPPLILSPGSQILKELPWNTWLFQLMEIYQSKWNFWNIPQVWNFIKRDHEVLAICEDLHGNLMVFLGNNIFEQYTPFKDLTLYVTGGKCLLKEEYFDSLKLLQSA